MKLDKPLWLHASVNFRHRPGDGELADQQQADQPE
jgi:hypothetical protein